MGANSPRPRGQYDVIATTVLDQVMAHTPLTAVDLVPGAGAVETSLRGLCRLLGQDYPGALADTRRAAGTATTLPERWLARGLLAFVQASSGVHPDDGDALGQALDDLEGLIASATDPTLHTLTVHLLAEGACAQYRIDDGLRLLDAAGSPAPAFLLDADGRPHPYLEIIDATQVRLLIWAGRTDAALARLDALQPPQSTAGTVLQSACRAVASGHAADRAAIRGFAATVEEALPDPRDHIGAGYHLLAAYGLASVGETARAARAVLLAGGGADLPRMNIIDRAMSLELLAAAALLDGDLDAAEAWTDRMSDLAGSPIAGATVSRARARLALFRGDLAAAHAEAQAAREGSARAGRPVEVSDADVLLSQIEIAQTRSGRAQDRLAALVADAEPRGHRATRLAANRELRRVGRRLPPPRGGGWDALTAREREVALAVADGRSNPEIAEQLHLSPHTVRLHVSRVLAAYGVASRTLLAAVLADRLPPRELPPLTARQLEVARLVAEGARNADIAEALGIAVATAEEHVASVIERWQVPSRAGIAAAVARTALGAGEE